MADISGSHKPASRKEPEKRKEVEEKKSEDEKQDPHSQGTNGTNWSPIVPNLRYNIEIHLPATKDIEVYNAIFKSLREHLIND